MHDRLRRAEHPVVSVAPLDPDAGFVGGDNCGLAQGRYGLLAAGAEAALRPAKQVHQTALAELQAE